MARMARKPPEDSGGEIKTKDFATAVKLYRNDILPAQAKVGEYAQEQSTAYKAIKKQCCIQGGAARAAFKLEAMEDAKREDWLRSFNGLLKEMGIDLKPDLVDAMEGDAPAPKRGKPKLVTVPGGEPSDASETDLTDAADTEPRNLDLTGEGFTEASAEELAAQEGRKPADD